MIIIAHPLTRQDMASVAAIPSSTGILISINITSGRSFSALLIASSPLWASPTTSTRGSKLSRHLTLSQVSGTSSTIKTRIFLVSCSKLTPIFLIDDHHTQLPADNIFFNSKGTIFCFSLSVGLRNANLTLPSSLASIRGCASCRETARVTV